MSQGKFLDNDNDYPMRTESSGFKCRGEFFGDLFEKLVFVDEDKGRGRCDKVYLWKLPPFPHGTPNLGDAYLAKTAEHVKVRASCRPSTSSANLRRV